MMCSECGSKAEIYDSVLQKAENYHGVLNVFGRKTGLPKTGKKNEK